MKQIDNQTKKRDKCVVRAMEDCIDMISNKVSNSVRCSRPVKMMFSSYGFRSPVMREKYAKVIKQDEALKKKSCMIIPFAGFNTEKTFDVKKCGLIEFGFDSERVFNADHVALVTTPVPDLIYVPGGDPFKLLTEIRERNLIPKIRKWVLDCKSIYVGVSAGAYVASQYIAYVKQLEDDNFCEKITTV